MTCHPEAGAGWQGSHHDRAMQVATTATVLGDFASVEVADAGRTATFERQGDRFMVHTEGRDGAMHAFSVVFTFGVEPLQQAILELMNDSSLRQRLAQAGHQWVEDEFSQAINIDRLSKALALEWPQGEAGCREPQFC
jgi:hypothetical protein